MLEIPVKKELILYKKFFMKKQAPGHCLKKKKKKNSTKCTEPKANSCKSGREKNSNTSENDPRDSIAIC